MFKNRTIGYTLCALGVAEAVVLCSQGNYLLGAAVLVVGLLC